MDIFINGTIINFFLFVNNKMSQLYIILCLLITGILYIATTSIGIQCLNEKKETGSSYYFLIINLVSAILVLLSAIVMLYMSITGKL